MKKLQISLIHTFRKNSTSSSEQVKVLKKVKRVLEQSTGILEGFLKKELKINLRHGVTCTVSLCGEYKIKSLNSTYRKKNLKTDVLSFPIFDLDSDLSLPIPIELGDIFICYQVASSQSKELNVSLENEIVHLFVHGFLHLLGFDHERSSKDEQIMLKWEEYLMKRIHKIWEK